MGNVAPEGSVPHLGCDLPPGESVATSVFASSTEKSSPIGRTSSHDVITSPIAGTSAPLQGSEQLSRVGKCLHLLGNADLEFDDKNTSELSNTVSPQL